MIAVFNRSYYEAVLVERVKGIAAGGGRRSRYPHINDFELLLTQSRTIVPSSSCTSARRNRRSVSWHRQQEVAKSWKLSLGDWQERQYWDEYIDAYQRAIARRPLPTRPGT